MMHLALRVVGPLVCAIALGACQHSEGGSTTRGPVTGLPAEGKIASVPLGDVAGVSVSTVDETIVNPLRDNPQAQQEGHELYIKMNCAGCHGYTAEGAMGPDLTDKYWRYGGTPAEIYKSIYEGRPQGMPAWGDALPPQEIWKLVAYIQTLGGSYPAAAYHAAKQGDRVNENVTPEAKAEETVQQQHEQQHPPPAEEQSQKRGEQGKQNQQPNAAKTSR
jgi:cytochrome c oxidase cbb3-type subunit III